MANFALIYRYRPNVISFIDFNSLKSLNQYISRNKINASDFVRLMYCSDSKCFEPFFTSDSKLQICSRSTMKVQELQARYSSLKIDLHTLKNFSDFKLY